MNYNKTCNDVPSSHALIVNFSPSSPLCDCLTSERCDKQISRTVTRMTSRRTGIYSSRTAIFVCLILCLHSLGVLASVGDRLGKDPDLINDQVFLFFSFSLNFLPSCQTWKKIVTRSFVRETHLLQLLFSSPSFLLSFWSFSFMSWFTFLFSFSSNRFAIFVSLLLSNHHHFDGETSILHSINIPSWLTIYPPPLFFWFLFCECIDTHRLLSRMSFWMLLL